MRNRLMLTSVIKNRMEKFPKTKLVVVLIFSFVQFINFAGQANEPPNPPVFHFDVPVLGITNKESGSYQNLLQTLTYAVAETNSEQIQIFGADNLKGENLLSQVLSFCGDKDYSDKIAWQTFDFEANRRTLVFKITCQEDLTEVVVKSSQASVFDFKLVFESQDGNGSNYSLRSVRIMPIETVEVKKWNARYFCDQPKNHLDSTLKLGGAAALGYRVGRQTFPGRIDSPLHAGGTAGLAYLAGSTVIEEGKLFARPKTFWERFVMAGASGMFLGLMKEGIDKGTGGHGSLDDLYANAQGAPIGAMIYAIERSFDDCN